MSFYGLSDKAIAEDIGGRLKQLRLNKNYSLQELIELTGLSMKAVRNAEQGKRTLVTNVLARNVDDHTKNISYVMDQTGVWHLAPAYDVTLSYDSAELLGDRNKMKINGKQKDFSKQDFIEFAHNMGVNKPEVIIEEVCDAICHWQSYAHQAGVTLETAELIQGLFLSEP